MKKQNVNVFPAALMTCLARTVWRIHQTQINHFHTCTKEPRRHLCHVSLEPLL